MVTSSANNRNITEINACTQSTGETQTTEWRAEVGATNFQNSIYIKISALSSASLESLLQH